MAIAITDEHVALSASVGGFLGERCRPEAVRAMLDAEHQILPPFWSDFAQLGWLTIHLPEEFGGEGFGVPEAAVVLEELGRAAAPGPFLPTMVAALLVARSAGEAVAKEVLAPIAAGASAAAFAFPGTGRLDGVAGPDGGLAVNGTLGPVPGASLADWIVAPVETADGGIWVLLPATSAEVVELSSLDPAWRGASVTVRAVAVPAEHVLALDTEEVEAVAATLVTAECAGGAGWCVETAAAYAKVREQFGRPIGQFQAVKHRCADMLVAAEQVRALAWDAAQAISNPGQSGRPLAVVSAAALGPDRYVQVAKDCIQVLGGIGFTWEHDAHRYLRRSLSLRQMMGGASPWKVRLAARAVAGERRVLALDLPQESETVRAEVRAFVASVAGLDRRAQRARLVESGYFMPHWEPPWGRAAGAVEQLVIDEELAAAGIRRQNLAVGAWAAPTIAAHGTPDQQERWVGPTLRGEIRWCQLFSEPGAGSDLAALSTRATRAPGGWELSGQKVWTSLATEADWGICLARTDPAAPKHLGITYFVLDMAAEGIEIRPLRELTGMAMFNEVFLTDVFVPDDCVVGAVDGGWPLARTTLANERVAMGSGSSFGGGVEALLALAAGMPAGRLGPIEMERIGTLVAEAQSVAVLGLRSTARALSGARPGPEASVRKLLGAEHDQRTQELGLELLGPDGCTLEGPGAQWTFGFLANRCLTIAGGTSEVQRNVIGERLLGLPRDPEPAG